MQPMAAVEAAPDGAPPALIVDAIFGIGIGGPLSAELERHFRCDPRLAGRGPDRGGRCALGPLCR